MQQVGKIKKLVCNVELKIVGMEGVLLVYVYGDMNLVYGLVVI